MSNMVAGSKWTGKWLLLVLASREILIGLLVAATAIFVATMGEQVTSRVADQLAAPQDNVQWSLAQLDVELLALNVAVRQAADGQADSIVELRKRFEIYANRVNTTVTLPAFRYGKADRLAADDLANLQTITKGMAAKFAGPDAALSAQMAGFSADVERMRPLAQQISLEGVELYANQSDAQRNSFRQLLRRISLANTLLTFALGAALLFLIRQISISRTRSGELEASSDRNARTVNASIDAIIIINLQGVIVEFNSAASHTFGYTRNAAIGAKLDELIIPERFRARHNAGLARFRENGQAKMIGAGRIEMSALRADGTEFPIELSLGMTHSIRGPKVIAFLRDISQRVEQDLALMKARDEALDAAQAKAQFVAKMSHEMRTPLNGVMAVLDLLQSTKLSDKQKAYVDTATTSAEALKQHVDDVLDLTDVQAGKLKLDAQPFHLGELLNEIMRSNEDLAAKRGNRISLDVKIDRPHFVADRKRIKQVLNNLVGNAIKFTENGNIKIGARFHGAAVEFFVRDHGIGIALDKQKQIFENFETLAIPDQDDTRGVGLGLAICRSIAVAMGGSMGVESELGHGATFWFRILLKAADSGSADQISAARAKVPDARRMRVLVVDDNETNRFVAEEMLLHCQCIVVMAQDGVAGVKAAAREKFDLILMDISMPQLNGWEATRKIRQSAASKSRSAPIFALTAQAMPEGEDVLAKAGMQGHILKPLRARALDEILMMIRNEKTREQAKIVEAIVENSGAIDTTVVEELKDILGLKGFAERVDHFLRELHSDPIQLGEMALNKQSSELSKRAHRLAGSAAVFGATELRELCLKLEVSASKMNQKQAVAAVREVQLLANRYSAQYQELVALAA